MDEVSTPNIEKKIREIEQEILPYTEIKKGDNIVDHTERKRIHLSNKLYIIFPVVFLLLLIIFQPGFIKKTTIKNGKEEKNFCIKKLFLFWLILSMLSCIGIFAYNYKKF